MGIKYAPNWHSYLSLDKKFFGISEIVFIQKGDIFNSFMRKSIIIDRDLNIFCNILGKHLSSDKFESSFNKMESQDHLTTLINELVSVKICRRLDFLNIKK